MQNRFYYIINFQKINILAMKNLFLTLITAYVQFNALLRLVNYIVLMLIPLTKI